MVALRSQGNWRWEGPLGTPLGLVHWKSHEQRRLEGHSVWGLKEPDTTERLTFSLSLFTQSQCFPLLDLAPGR